MWGYWKDIKSDYESKLTDPWDWVTHFENAIARYAGAKHGIACDSNTNAIRLLIHYFKDVITGGGVGRDYNWNIPKNTYVSVPNQLILSGCKFKFIDKKWDNMYRIGTSPIIDAAVSLKENMFQDNQIYNDDCMVLSFHHRKIIQIGKGGMILTNDDKLEQWLRPMIYDGRKKYAKYDEDEFECIGWHMYMTPEDAKKGFELFHSKDIIANNESRGSSKTYKDLSKSKIFTKYRVINDTRMYNHNGDIMLNKIPINEIDGVTYTIQDHIFMRDVAPMKFIEKEWETALSKLDLSAAAEEINYILIENIECNDVDFYQNSKEFNYLMNYFQGKGINHKFIVYGNNLSKRKYPFNYIKIPFFLGDSVTQLKPIKKRTFDKKFLFLNAYPKLHRTVSYCKFSDLNLLDDMYYTFNPNQIEIFQKIDREKYPNTGKLESSGGLEISDMHKIPPHYYKSFCNIITESHFTKEQPMFITEKLDKSITALQPFLIIGTAGFLKNLHELGLKTFSDFWDESYDDIKNDFTRLNAVVDVVQELSKKSHKELEEMYEEMLPILKHNLRTVINHYMMEQKRIICSEIDISVYGTYRRMIKKSEGILSKSLI